MPAMAACSSASPVSPHSRSPDVTAFALANGYAERLIGSIRQECLDHVAVFSERHLRHLLLSYMHYYNIARTHLSLGKDAPIPAPSSRSRRHPRPVRSWWTASTATSG